LTLSLLQLAILWCLIEGICASQSQPIVCILVTKSSNRIQEAEQCFYNKVNLLVWIENKVFLDENDNYYAVHRSLEELEAESKLNASQTFMNIFMALVCVCVAALAAGLTMGMVSIEPLQLLIKMRVGTPLEKKHANALLPLVQQHHRLLVTLLLCNSLANEALPLFLDKVVPGYVAVLISVSLVLIFGEILPSAVFTGPQQIPMAASMTPMVRILMYVLSPVAYPIAKLLDKCLGHDDSHYVGDVYSRGEISALVRVLYEEQARKQREMKTTMLAAATTLSTRSHSQLSRQLSRSASAKTEDSSNHKQYLHVDEVTMVEGALSMKTKTARDVYQPIAKVFAVNENTILDEETMATIYNSGHSRIPVYQENADGEEPTKNIKAILLSRNLIVVDSDDARPVHTLPLLQPYCVTPNVSLVDLINQFQSLGPNFNMAGHLAIVCEDAALANYYLNEKKPIPPEANVLGIVTLEDVFEELLQEEIVDESDKREMAAMRIARKTMAKWRKFVQKKKYTREHAGHQEDFVSESDQHSHLDVNTGGVDSSEASYSTTPLLNHSSSSTVSAGRRGKKDRRSYGTDFL